ncbi:MAG: DUF374 domain-containing protein [Acidobacteriota bacterium]|nr:DUF374 domain-containing protein [Acidobacteriota bacterium]
MGRRMLYVFAAFFVRTLSASLRAKHAHVERIESTPQYILTFWHAHLLTMLHSKFRRPITVMSSQSKDGEISAQVFRFYDVGVVRGSSSRGANAALREFVRKARGGSNLVFTPDGPRGPARVAKPGVIFAAQMTGLPILPMAFAAKKKSCSDLGTGWWCRGRSPERCTATASRSSSRVMVTSKSGA